MSIFKVKEWWTTGSYRDIENLKGSQNFSSLKVDKFNCHSESDCIIVGDSEILKIYKPIKDETVSPLLIELQLKSEILQLDTGKFTVDCVDRQIIVLLSQSYEIYQLYRKEGHTEAGDQNILKRIIKHSFTRRSYSITCGTFGNVKSRDFICVQSLDGTLSFFDQDTFLFMYIFHDVIIPGPVAYIPNSDSFIICKTSWVMEIHSYQQLQEFSELNATQNKKNIVQWVFNAGEEISSIQIIQTSSNFSSIIALGERYLYCFQDNGLMKYMLKFDFTPLCSFAYLIGWYYEPGARLLIMVTTDDAKLNIYEGTTMLWSCGLLQPAISISRCFLKGLPGGMAMLSTDGRISVGYLGTEPDLNANATPMINDAADSEQVQKDLEVAESLLQKVLHGNEDTEDQYRLIENILKIKADVGKPVVKKVQLDQISQDDKKSIMICPVVVILTCQDPKQIQSIQITYKCCEPFAFTDSTVCLDNINGTEIIETQIVLANEADLTKTRVQITFMIIDSSEKIIILTREVSIPLSLYCSVTETANENKLALYIQTNNTGVDLRDVFTDFIKEDLSKYGNSNTITFIYTATNKTVTVKAASEQYVIEANDFPEINSIFDHFIIKLREYFSMMNKEFKFNIRLDEEFAKKLTHRFLKSIDAHAKERVKLKDLEDEMNVLQKQFTLVQKRLLVQYGSLPPGDCNPLEFLMKDTHNRIVTSVQNILQSREYVRCAGNTLTAIGNLMISILKQCINDEFKVKLIEEMMALDSLYETYQEWEEAVTQSLFYLLNNIFFKTEKDKEKLASVTEQGVLSHTNLKRFLKQMRIILDKIFDEACTKDTEGKTSKITRIEEFVEVI